MVGVVFAVIVVVVVVIWLALNVVLPILLLNSALVLTILALVYKARRPLFAGFALVGGCYLLIDVFAGWMSALFVQNVVGDTGWITLFAYLNACAVGVSAWLLVQPIWDKGLEFKESDRNKSIALIGGSIALVVAATVSIPLAYYFIPNRLGIVRTNSGSSGGPSSQPGTATKGTYSNVDAGLPVKFNRSYEGTIGNQTFSISLFRDGDRLTGQASTSRKTDTLSGTINRNGQFEAQGLENGERFTGKYKGTVFANGSVEGKWTKPDGSKETAFSVSQTQ